MLWWVGAASPVLFAALLAGGVLAWRAPTPLALPEPARVGGLCLVGVAAGSSLDEDVLDTVLGDPVLVLGCVLATLAVSLLVGQVLRLDRDVDGATAAFASVAGGASGVALTAREFGADEATVMAVQYLRVVVVLVSVPLVAPLLGDAGGAVLPDEAPTDLVSQHLFTGCAVLGGLLLARLIRFPAAPILWSLVVASALELSGWFADARVPGWVVAVGFTVVGANVGLSFTPDRLRRLSRLLPLALVQVALTVLACGAIGLVFADALGIPGSTATSPPRPAGCPRWSPSRSTPASRSG
nr:AbrB family transcriptional regulator [Nocardioides sambongensis]